MQPPADSTLSSVPRPRLKPALWAVMGFMALSVFFYAELPLLFKDLPCPHDPGIKMAHGRHLLLLLVPHILAGTLALIAGPLQFSSRLRSRNIRLHRLLGRVYVYSVFTVAPLAIALATLGHFPHHILFLAAIVIQSGAWLTATTIAFVAALHRRIQQHRQWMVRSYAVTFTFVCTRVLKPLPAWRHMDRTGNAVAIIVITLLAILLPGIVFKWQQIAARRA